jgi:hypothetical protein
MRIILWALIILSPLVALAQNYHWSLSNAQTTLLQTRLAGVAIAFIREHNTQGADLRAGRFIHPRYATDRG